MKIALSFLAAGLYFATTAQTQKALASSFAEVGENGGCTGNLLSSSILDAGGVGKYWSDCVKTSKEAQCAAVVGLTGFNEACSVHVWEDDACQGDEKQNWPISIAGNQASNPGTKWNSLKIMCNPDVEEGVVGQTPAPEAPCTPNLPDGKWPSENEPDFPTVNSLREDMKLCGKVGKNTIFYSFGARTSEVVPFRDSLEGGGVMFNDALPGDWTRVMAKKFPILERTIPQQVLAARWGEAMASLAYGEVFLVTADNLGAYTIPNPPRLGEGPNVWRFAEFPTLQRNKLVSKVTRVENAPPFRRTVDWEGFKNYPELPESQAMKYDPNAPSLPPGVPPAQPQRRFRRF